MTIGSRPSKSRLRRSTSETQEFDETVDEVQIQAYFDRVGVEFEAVKEDVGLEHNNEPEPPVDPNSAENLDVEQVSVELLTNSTLFHSVMENEVKTALLNDTELTVMYQNLVMFLTRLKRAEVDLQEAKS